MCRSPAVASLVVLAAVGIGVAGADILVTRDGASIETSGAWSVEGRRVIFTMPNGTLSSLRTEDVDLDRSAVATARAAEAASRAAAAPSADAARSLPPLAPPPPPVMRITDKDLEPPAAPPEEADSAEAAVEGSDPAPAADDNGPLQVISWDRVDLQDGDGVEIFGTIQNTSSAMVAAPTITVFVYGERGGLLATGDGSVNLATIPPGKTANFRAPLPGLYEFSAIKFDLGGRGYRTRREPTGSDETGAEDVEEEPTAAEEEVDVDPGAKYDEMAENLYEENYEEPVAEEEPESESEPIDEEPPPLG